MDGKRKKDAEQTMLKKKGSEDVNDRWPSEYKVKDKWTSTVSHWKSKFELVLSCHFGQGRHLD